MTNTDELSVVSAETFSKAVSQFHELINSCDAKAFLIGAGCSKCAGLPLTKELTEKVIADAELDCLSKQVLITIRAIFSGAPDAHIEDYLSEIVDLLAITDRRAERGVEQNTVVVGDASYTAEQLRKASNQIKRAIASTIEGKISITTHQEFVASVHQPVRVGRPVPSQPVDYLVLNYDTIIEDALALESIPYADGLSGGATGWWEPDTFDANGLFARVIKLHGSINWRQFSDELSPRRVGPSIQLPGEADLPVLIWPSSTKYQETQLDPFAQLLERARKALRPNAGSQRLLVICGYSFGDSHINLEIDKALHESEGNLTIAAFTDGDEPTGQLQKWHEDDALREQVLIFANRGFFHGDTKITSTKDLLWWKFENLTRILKGGI